MEERLNRRNWAGLSPCRKSAGFTIDTNAEPHKLSTSCDPGPAGEFQLAWGCTKKGTLTDELRNLGLLTRYFPGSLLALPPPTTAPFDTDRVFSNDRAAAIPY